MMMRLLIPSAILVVCLAVPIPVNTVTPESKPGEPDRALLKVALLQMLPDGNNQSANMDKAETFCRQAASLGADIALMPEMWNIGYTSFDAKKEGAREQFWQQAVATDHPSIQRFARLARELNMAIAVTYEQAGGTLAAKFRDIVRPSRRRASDLRQGSHLRFSHVGGIDDARRGFLCCRSRYPYRTCQGWSDDLL
jgi:predicted amidohydrolase